MGISPVITIDNNNIIQVDKTKFLGVIINKTLTWTDHIHIIKSKVSKNLGLISFIKKNVPLSVLKTLYNTLVQPYLEYCNIVWAIHRSRTMWILEPFSHLATTGMGRKLEGCTALRRSWVPIQHNVARAETYLHAKFHLDPSNRLVTIPNVTDRQTVRQTVQRSDSIARTVLQTVAQ